MADLRVPPSTVPARTTAPPAPVRADGSRAEAVRAAQRAFFDAALAQAGAPAAVAAVTKAVSPSAAVAPTTLLNAPPAQPGRLLRPGSLVDVKA